MTPKDFQTAARDLADRLEATPDAEFVSWNRQSPTGHVALAVPEYAAIASEWVEFINPYRLDGDIMAYEAVARRGWDNAALIGGASWDDAIHIAASLIRAQRTRGGDILQQAHQRGMLVGTLRRLADLAGQPEGAQHFAKARSLFSPGQ